MKRFVPYDKMSKKQKRALDRKQRSTWERSPVTRIADGKTHYSRKEKHRQRLSDLPEGRSRFLLFGSLV